mgnify:FL=1
MTDTQQAPGKTGVAGCGRMGTPMLAALRAAGFDAHGLDVRPEAATDAVTLDPDTFADGLGTLITVVRDIPQTEEVLFAEQALVARAPGLRTIVLSSTLSPAYVRALRQRVPARIALVDAPMSGAQVRAERRELSFMLGGDVADLDRLQPLFDAMGATFHRMGPFGSGMAAKVLNNLLAASNTAMTRLVLDWADAFGLDQDRLRGLVHASSGLNWFASHFDEIEFARDGFGSENTIGILVKDVESALDVAPDGADTALPRAVQKALRSLSPRGQDVA